MDNDFDFDLFTFLASEWDLLKPQDEADAARSACGQRGGESNTLDFGPDKKRHRGGKGGENRGSISSTANANVPGLTPRTFPGYIPRTNQEKVRFFFVLKFFDFYNSGDLEMISELLTRYCRPDVCFKSNTHTNFVQTVADLSTFISYLMELCPDGMYIFDGASEATGGIHHLNAYQSACKSRGKIADDVPPADQTAVVISFSFQGTRLSGEKTVAEIYEGDLKNRCHDKNNALLTSGIESSKLTVLSHTSTDLDAMPPYESGIAPSRGLQEYITPGKTTLVFDASNMICIWYSTSNY